MQQRDSEQYTSLATPSPREDNPLIESEKELHPIDLDRDANAGDCLKKQVDEIEKAI